MKNTSWNRYLEDVVGCYADCTGNRPCDYGLPCDMCHSKVSPSYNQWKDNLKNPNYIKGIYKKIETGSLKGKTYTLAQIVDGYTYVLLDSMGDQVHETTKGTFSEAIAEYEEALKDMGSTLDREMEELENVLTDMEEEFENFEGWEED